MSLPKINVIDRRPMVAEGLGSWLTEFGVEDFSTDSEMRDQREFELGELYLVGIVDWFESQLDSGKLMGVLPFRRTILLSNPDELLRYGPRISRKIGGLVSPLITKQDLLSAFIAVHGNSFFIDDWLSAGWRAITGASFEEITTRQLEVLRWVQQGLSSKQIAKKLGIALSTVENHRTEIRKRLGAASSAEMISIALRHGLI